MIGILLLTHGGLARELLAAAETIAGPRAGTAAISLDWAETRDGARDEVGRALRHLDQGAGVLVLTDLAGGTPSNIALEFRAPGRIEVISGVNLPMVVRLFCLHRNGSSLEQVAEWIGEKGRSAICTPRRGRPSACLSPDAPLGEGELEGPR